MMFPTADIPTIHALYQRKNVTILELKEVARSLGCHHKVLRKWIDDNRAFLKEYKPSRVQVKTQSPIEELTAPRTSSTSAELKDFTLSLGEDNALSDNDTNASCSEPPTSEPLITTLQMSPNRIQSSQNNSSSQQTIINTPVKISSSSSNSPQFSAEDLVILYRARKSGMSYKNVNECAVIASILDTTQPCSHKTRLDMVTLWLKQNARVLPKNLLTMSRDLMNYQQKDEVHENAITSIDSIIVSTTKKYNGFTSFSKWYTKEHTDREHYETYLRDIGCIELSGPQVYNRVCSKEWMKLSKAKDEESVNDPSHQSYWKARAIEELASRSENQKLEDYAYSLRRIWKVVEKVRKALVELDVTAIMYMVSPNPRIVPDKRLVTNAASLEVFERLERSNVQIHTHLQSSDSYHRFKQVELRPEAPTSELLGRDVRKVATQGYKDRLRQLLTKLCQKHDIPLTNTGRPPGNIYTKYHIDGAPQDVPMLSTWRNLRKQEAEAILLLDTTAWVLRLQVKASEVSLKQHHDAAKSLKPAKKSRRVRRETNKEIESDG